jgi:hypothetical protein
MNDSRRTPPTAAQQGTPGALLSDDRVAAIVKAAYLLELARR